MRALRTTKSPHELLPGEYCKWRGAYYAHCPGPDDLVANLSAHKITEHDDGTLTVSPSILCSDGRHEWHGYLEQDVWRVA